MKRPNKKVKKGAPAWMTTFSDMMTLILVFFILYIAGMILYGFNSEEKLMLKLEGKEKKI